MSNSGAKFLVPDWVIYCTVVDSDIGLSYWPASLHKLAGGPVRQPYGKVENQCFYLTILTILFYSRSFHLDKQGDTRFKI
jgi:hypothetical protein